MLFSNDRAGMFLCVSGKSTIIVNSNKYQFSRGMLCFFGPVSNIDIIMQSADCRWEQIIDASDILYPVADNVVDIAMSNYLFKSPCIQLDEKQIDVFMFFVEMIRNKRAMLENTSMKDLSKMINYNIVMLEQVALMEFLSLYFKNCPIVPQKVSKGERIAYDFLDSLYQNYSKERSVNWYAEQANLSPTYFSQIVRRYTELTPVEWIKEVTISNAKMYLADPQLSIKEVAVKLNFADQLSFRKFFKNCTGMSPKQYRETLR